VSVVVPYYYELGDDQVLAHFSAVVEALGAVLAYVIPARTVNDVSAPLLARLAAAGVAGVKDSTKSLERHEAFLDVGRRHQGFRVYMGSDGLAAAVRGEVRALAVDSGVHQPAWRSWNLRQRANG
jgi:4-hydroxy-tetrahydrodipicolinate synthase